MPPYLFDSLCWTAQNWTSASQFRCAHGRTRCGIYSCIHALKDAEQRAAWRGVIAAELQRILEHGVCKPKRKKQAPLKCSCQGVDMSLCNVSFKKGRVGCGHEVSAGGGGIFKKKQQAFGSISRSRCG